MRSFVMKVQKDKAERVKLLTSIFFERMTVYIRIWPPSYLQNNLNSANPITLALWLIVKSY